MLRDAINQRLHALLRQDEAVPELLNDALVYSLLAPGKRIRPMIALLTSSHFGRDDVSAVDCACGFEMIHAASLTMDDLPMMDNSDLRRNQPTTHRRFGEDVAVLSSIGLLSLAFGVVASNDTLDPDVRTRVVRVMADAVGPTGLVGGQVMDLRTQDADADQTTLVQVNLLKTGKLFAAAAEAGAIVGGASHELQMHARSFGRELGLAFQIADDVLDGMSSATSGKDQGKDANKPTLCKLLGIDGARRLYKSHSDKCRAQLAAIDASGSPLSRYVEDCFALVEV
jgi:geranylgeranyl pyrophosphate synthase